MNTINDVYSHAPGNLPPLPSPPSTRLREGRARNRGYVQRPSRLVATAAENRLKHSRAALTRRCGTERLPNNSLLTGGSVAHPPHPTRAGMADGDLLLNHFLDSVNSISALGDASVGGFRRSSPSSPRNRPGPRRHRRRGRRIGRRGPPLRGRSALACGAHLRQGARIVHESKNPAEAGPCHEDEYASELPTGSRSEP
jgi:hypothetical protein